MSGRHLGSVPAKEAAKVKRSFRMHKQRRNFFESFLRNSLKMRGNIVRLFFDGGECGPIQA